MSGALFAVASACVHGVEALPVTVEVSFANGIPGIQIVGMAGASVLEARHRIRCALRSSGFEVPRKSITVNLAPGDMRKTGSGFDLPIAVAILAASGQIPPKGLDGCLFAGELALDGTVCPVRGEVAFQLLARERSCVLLGAATGDHVSIEGADHLVVDHLSELVRGIDRVGSPGSTKAEPHEVAREALDFADVAGQEIPKRALAIAAAGGLGLLMVGPPGSGKTMLARRMTTILPALEGERRLEALRIHSVAGEPIAGLLSGVRPFRCPHHSISSAGLIGGGRPVRPGEVSLAHGGVLFLDELAEFPSHELQMLRQPMEEGSVRIVRAEGAFTLPCSFQFLAASNPCPCGYLGDGAVACTCSASAIERYRSRLGGPIADRIDMVVDVSRPDAADIVAGREGSSSADLKNVVERGREFASWRRERQAAGSDADADARGLGAEYDLTREASDRLVDMARGASLTGRGVGRLVRIARAIADTDQSERVDVEHLLEASMLRGAREGIGI